MWENTGQKNSKYGDFLHRVFKWELSAATNILDESVLKVNF